MKAYGLILTTILLLFVACEKPEVDKEKPSIDMSIQGAFPGHGDTIYFGEPFEFKALFSDNVELGSVKAYSIDIHNNFDHHSHSTEVSESNLDPEKEPVNPYLLTGSYDIPAGLSEYETDLVLTIPTGDVNGLYDEGDYHFFISLADHDGWSAQMGISIKMFHR